MHWEWKQEYGPFTVFDGVGTHRRRNLSTRRQFSATTNVLSPRVRLDNPPARYRRLAWVESS